MSDALHLDTRGTCRSCKARILWAETINGRRIPLDADAVAGGNIDLQYDGRARDRAPMALYKTPDPKILRYVAHFTTCPNARAHRKPRA